MSGLFTLLRASLLGACLCIAAAHLEHAQRFSLTQPCLAEQAYTPLAKLPPLDVQAQWSTASLTPRSYPVSPSDSQPLGDLGSTHSVNSDADDGDDFDDALSHGHLGLSCLDFGVAAQTRAVHREREHVRREDRRCDKPPRPRHV